MHNKLPIIIIFIGLLLFGVGSLPSCTDSESEEIRLSEAQNLEAVLSRVEGVGEVFVWISYEDQGEIVPLTDADGNAVILRGDGEKIGALKEKSPTVGGVLIVAEGAGDSRVRAELMTSVRALYDMNSDRICILKGKSVK